MQAPMNPPPPPPHTAGGASTSSGSSNSNAHTHAHTNGPSTSSSNHTNGQSSSQAGPERRQPQRRSSKACETCRVRRIRCVGPPPCEPCRSAGLGTSCTVRQKARPKRAPSAKLFLRRPVAADPSTNPLLKTDVTVSPPAPIDKRNPMEEIDSALAAWCIEKSVPFSSLVFTVESRLAGFPHTPLPPASVLGDFEDQLIDELFTQPEVQDRREQDRTLLRSMYERYRTVPHSLTDDQLALIFAALCIARFNQIRNSMPDGSLTIKEGVPREDVTYYKMAYSALASWQKPSLTALWAYFYLTPYTIANGGPGETRDLLTQMAWQIRQLGIYRQQTANLYTEQDQVGALFSAFFYTEMFRASLTDMSLVMPLSEIDVDPTPPPMMFSPCLARSSFFTAKLLADYTDPSVDTTSVQYITATEAAWMPYLRDIRHNNPESSKAKSGWAQFRYNWLRVLLYIPHIGHAQYSTQAFGAIVRAVTQIMYTYNDLIAAKQLNTSWPQVKRLVTCGHLLILSYEAGEIHRREAQSLFQMLVDLLDKHKETWPVCNDLVAGFVHAASCFDIEVGPEFAFPPPLPFFGDHLSNGSEDNSIHLQPPPNGAPPLQALLPFDLSFAFDYPTFPMG